MFSFVIKEKIPDLVNSPWIEDTKDFFLKYYTDIIFPGLLWRYGLGPRPSDTDPKVLTVTDLRHLAVLTSSEHNNPGLKASKGAQKEGGDRNSGRPKAIEGPKPKGTPQQEEVRVQNRGGSPGDTILEMAPILYPFFFCEI